MLTRVPLTPLGLGKLKLANAIIKTKNEVYVVSKLGAVISLKRINFVKKLFNDTRMKNTYFITDFSNQTKINMDFNVKIKMGETVFSQKRKINRKKGKKKQHGTHLHKGLFVQIVHNDWWDGCMEEIRENTYKIEHS